MIQVTLLRGFVTPLQIWGEIWAKQMIYLFRVQITTGTHLELNPMSKPCPPGTPSLGWGSPPLIETWTHHEYTYKVATQVSW